MEIKRSLGNGRMSGVVECDGRLYLSGITSFEEGITAQTKDVLNKLEERLAAGGSDKAHILRATIYLKDIRLFDEMNAVWDAWTNQEIAPARACVEARLAREAALIEIVVDAAVK